MGMTAHSLDLTEQELNLIYRLCENTPVQGLETAKALVGVMEKIRMIALPNQLPEGQTTLPTED